MHDNRPPQHIKTPIKQDAWRLSITLSWVVFLFTTLFAFVTFLLLATDSPPNSVRLNWWATFLGVMAAVLAAFQYLPQIVHTYQHKLVGALSIGMMLIQTPGSILMVISIVLRPGTNWTTWSTYAVTGILQGTLLVMCLCWKTRQHKLGIDDFGNPLAPVQSSLDSPVAVTHGPEDGEPVQEAVNAAVESDIHNVDGANATEVTPLLKQDSSKRKQAWFNWLSR